MYQSVTVYIYMYTHIYDLLSRLSASHCQLHYVHVIVTILDNSMFMSEQQSTLQIKAISWFTGRLQLLGIKILNWPAADV